ncbi:hypothetical protein B817_422 [Weissella confusa]|nr:hypothetical protein [Weissella confusa]
MVWINWVTRCVWAFRIGWATWVTRINRVAWRKDIRAWFLWTAWVNRDSGLLQVHCEWLVRIINTVINHTIRWIIIAYKDISGTFVRRNVGCCTVSISFIRLTRQIDNLQCVTRRIVDKCYGRLLLISRVGNRRVTTRIIRWRCWWPVTRTWIIWINRLQRRTIWSFRCETRNVWQGWIIRVTWRIRRSLTRLQWITRIIWVIWIRNRITRYILSTFWEHRYVLSHWVVRHHITTIEIIRCNCDRQNIFNVGIITRNYWTCRFRPIIITSRYNPIRR